MKGSQSTPNVAARNSIHGSVRRVRSEHQLYDEDEGYQTVPFLAIPGISSSVLKRKWTRVSEDPDSQTTSLLHGPASLYRPEITRTLILSSLVALMASFQYGYNIGVVNAPAFSDGGEGDNFCSGDDKSKCVIYHGHTALQWTLVVSTWIFGGAIGAMLGGTMADSLGRKMALLTVSAVTAIGCIIEATSGNIATLIFGRFVVGLACGAGTGVIGTYLGELPPPSLRGALGTCNQFGCVCGILFSNVLAFPLGDEDGWRYFFGLPIVFSGLTLLSAPFIVESPRWLASRGDMEGAAAVLRDLRDRDDVLNELDNIVAASARETETELEEMSFSELFQPYLRRPLIISVALQMAQQLCGVNAVFFYSGTFFNMSDARVGTVLVGAVNLLACAAAIPLMDRMGRRSLLLVSQVGAGFSLAALFVTKLAGWNVLSVVMVMLFVVFFELGLGPIPWLITAEIFPARSRAKAVAFSTAVNWCCNLVVGLAFPYMSSGIGEAESFLPFTCVCLAAFFFTRKHVPETKNKSLDEIQIELGISEAPEQAPVF